MAETMATVAQTAARPIRRHLNKLRWLSLSCIFTLLLLIPAISIYQTYMAAHAYDLLAPSEQLFYDSMEILTSPFSKHLDIIKGNTWSATIAGMQISDPLAWLGQYAASLPRSPYPYWPFALSALVPVLLSIVFGRFFCGWICPATFIYELNSNFAIWLQQFGSIFGWQFDPNNGNRNQLRRMKYMILTLVLILSASTGVVLVAMIYPPAIIGRELYLAIALGGFGTGTLLFMLTLLVDLFVTRRGFCRYLCPGGALYTLLGHYRLLRIQRQVTQCNDCAKCNAACEFGLDPMRDDFGNECNNCTACIATCPTDALHFTIQIHDQANQGDGHLGAQYRSDHRAL